MTNTILTADSIGTNLTYTFGATGDIFVLAAGTRLIGDGYGYLFGTNTGINVTIDGYVWLEANLGSPFYFFGNDRITIGPHAQMVLSSAANYNSIMLG
jgi:hypothetical protein